MIRKLVKMGHPQLMQPSEKVSKEEFGTNELREIISDLWENCAHYDGIGIAAPQIGIFKQIAVLGFESSPRYKGRDPVPRMHMINPVVEPLTIAQATEEDWEGCLSIPGLRGVVPRATKIKCSYYDVEGQHHDQVFEDFHARVVQHEADHLQGNLYPCRMKNFKKFGYEDTLPEFTRYFNQQEDL